MSKEELMSKLNTGRKKELLESDIFGAEIKISNLKKIDLIFKKGLSYYLDPKNIVKSSNESIFFRKDNFNAELNLAAKQVVNEFEEQKISFHTLSKLADFKLNRKIKVYNINDNPLRVANEVRKDLYPDFDKNHKKFLENFINKLAESKILVFEFVVHPAKKEKPNINGFYLNPDVIVLKRNQKSFNREIFTLAHELGHYLINQEEIDDNIDNEIINNNNLSLVERWCNDFAYYFLISNFHDTINALESATQEIFFHTNLLRRISENTHLSTISLYTRLLLIQKITPANYNKVKAEIFNSIKEWEQKESAKLEAQKKKAKEEGRKIIIPQQPPIFSKLYLQTLQSTLYTGIINEVDFCKKLNIKPQKIEKYLI